MTTACRLPNQLILNIRHHILPNIKRVRCPAVQKLGVPSLLRVLGEPTFTESMIALRPFLRRDIGSGRKSRIPKSSQMRRTELAWTITVTAVPLPLSGSLSIVRLRPADLRTLAMLMTSVAPKNLDDRKNPVGQRSLRARVMNLITHRKPRTISLLIICRQCNKHLPRCKELSMMALAPSKDLPPRTTLLKRRDALSIPRLHQRLPRSASPSVQPGRWTLMKTMTIVARMTRKLLLAGPPLLGQLLRPLQLQES